MYLYYLLLMFISQIETVDVQICLLYLLLRWVSSTTNRGSEVLTKCLIPDGRCRRTSLSSIVHPAPLERFMYACIWQYLGIFLLSETCALFCFFFPISCLMFFTQLGRIQIQYMQQSFQSQCEKWITTHPIFNICNLNVLIDVCTYIYIYYTYVSGSIFD